MILPILCILMRLPDGDNPCCTRGDFVIIPGIANLSFNIELSLMADPKGVLASNIGRAIVNKLAVKLEGNKILGVDDFNVFAC